MSRPDKQRTNQPADAPAAATTSTSTSASAAAPRDAVDRPELPAGLVILDKPYGMTSMQAIARIRRRAGGRKTGHAGTLDPLATGVLVIAVGKATKSLDRFMRTDKRYTTTIDLSAFTPTDDLESEPVPLEISQPPSLDAVHAALAQFIGEIEQRPPVHSAVQVAGERAYHIARRGELTELPARRVLIRDIQLLRYEWPVLEIIVHTERGVYIRSLARDLGLALQTGGHCTALRRTAVGPFDEAMAVTLDKLPEDCLRPEHVLPIEQALRMVGEA